ncbi:hypothetical protein [Kitasatospora sp. HPMI-4]|uniref:hypothetical protein n=1 Tax=Kitasatospora sp. HPMI-4 TaxID=3448443 RepID=UPI003F1C8ADD
MKKPGIRLLGYRRLRLPSLGEVRTHNSGKRLARLIGQGQAAIQSVTVSRGGHRWYASVLVKVQQELPDKPIRRQAERGTVGVDLAALSRPLDPDRPGSDLVANPRQSILDAAPAEVRRQLTYTAVRKRRVVHSSTLDGLGLLSQTRVQSRRLSFRRGRRAGLLAGNRIAINGVGGG